MQAMAIKNPEPGLVELCLPHPDTWNLQALTQYCYNSTMSGRDEDIQLGTISIWMIPDPIPMDDLPQHL